MDAARAALVSHGVKANITACGLPRGRGGEGRVAFRAEKDGQGKRAVAVDGVLWCGSARCPRCAPLVGKQLQERVQEVMDASWAKDWHVVLVTMTAGHDRHTRLIDARKDMGDAWTGLQRGAPWNRAMERGMAGVVRVWEPTWGWITGWHLHPHCLLIHKGTAEEALAEGEWLIDRWMAAMRKRGWPVDRQGQDVRLVTRPASGEAGDALSRYEMKSMTGWGAAAEMASGWVKEGRRPDRLSVPQLLGLAAAGDEVAAEKYAEAVSALKGQRVFMLGPRLAAELGIEASEVEDEEEIEVEAQDGEVLGELPGSVWVAAAKRRLRGWALAEIERLTAFGICWEDVESVVTDRVQSRRQPAPA